MPTQKNIGAIVESLLNLGVDKLDVSYNPIIVSNPHYVYAHIADVYIIQLSPRREVYLTLGDGSEHELKEGQRNAELISEAVLNRIHSILLKKQAAL